jgi:hypothetical protein
MSPSVLKYLQEIGRVYGRLGGKRAAQNMTPGERTAAVDYE